ncbi:hypothetical protein ACYPKM_00885 [Pseudomonas aeruginosa]
MIQLEFNIFAQASEGLRQLQKAAGLYGEKPNPDLASGLFNGVVALAQLAELPENGMSEELARQLRCIKEDAESSMRRMKQF